MDSRVDPGVRGVDASRAPRCTSGQTARARHREAQLGRQTERMPRRASIHIPGFAHANPIPAASRIGPHLASGALTGLDPATGAMADGPEAQTAVVFGHIRALMAAAGGSTDDILKLTFRLADARDRDALNREWLAMFPDASSRPARQVVAASLDGGALVHCDLVAILPE
jgi:2-iminobutanoate/2-iminopropanoate deaminase